ncbi:MAG: EAL domain-containing protein [Cyanobacteria bacterium P01_A01_bin.114]
MTAYLDVFERTLERAQQRFQDLTRQIAQAPDASSASSLLDKAREQLLMALEEVHVLLEELTVQHDQLQTAHLVLQTEHQQYFELFDLAPDGYIVTNAKGVIEQVNRVAATLLNRHPDLLVGNPIAALLAPSEVCEFYTVLNKLQQGTPSQNVTFCLRPYLKLPLYASFTIAPVYDHQDQLVSLRWLFRDLTQQRQAAMALKESERRYATLAAIVPVGIFRADAEGACTYVNERWCQITGLTPAAAAGDGWIQGLYPEDRDRIATEWAQAVQENRPFQLEYRFQCPDGNVTWVYGQSVAEKNQDGQIIGYVGTITDISDLKQAQATILHNALHDSLTQLPNRTLLLERLDLAINKVRRCTTCRYAVLFLDLDRFKVINDSLGHGVGDQLLKEIAHKLKKHVRDIDLVARLGGDEFVILLEDINPAIVIQITERILADCQRPFTVNGHKIFTSLSIGIVLSTPEHHQAADLIRDADIAMYRAKASDNNSYVFFDASMHTQVLKRLTLETALRKALEQEEFTVYYQPVFNLRDNCLVGLEALVRWQHPTRGVISPDEFMSVAEEMGLTVPLDSWVLHQACQQMGRWQTQFTEAGSLKVSINLSAQDLRKRCLVEEIDHILVDTGLGSDSIILEITEGILIEDIDRSIDCLTQLRSRNVQISIDDFGTGYSSLNYLHRLPVSHLKIDRSFVGHMQSERRNYQVVSSILALSDQLGLVTVAEGIETPQQLQQLHQLGCQLGQGYLFSRPLAARDIEASFLSADARSRNHARNHRI